MDRIKQLHQKIQDLYEELRTCAENVEDPLSAELCDTSSEVVGGIEEAFDSFIEEKENPEEE